MLQLINRELSELGPALGLKGPTVLDGDLEAYVGAQHTLMLGEGL
jgi:hypothetical protein